MTNLTKEQIIEIGKRNNLSDRKLKLFVAYVMARGFIRDDYYIREWADRFSGGIEWEASDQKGRNILIELEKEIK
jgi:hypothetical protein